MSDLEQAYHARGGDIYHLDPLCPEGRQLPPEWRVAGSAGLALCPTCWARARAKRPSGPYVPPSAPSPARTSDGSGSPSGSR
jgi:hypothetical protein